MKHFKRVIENFVCENCGQEVVGNGYTDHCPKCLWGKHVDEETPGDRASPCKGMMEPVRAEYQRDKYKIIYKCVSCNHKFEVWEGEEDDREMLLGLLK